MATKKATGTKSSGKTKTKTQTKSESKSKKKKQDGYFKTYLKKHKEFSKIITGCVLIYAIWFTDRVLDVMVEFQVFDSLDTLIEKVCYMGMVALGTYAFRQRGKDKVELESLHREKVNEEQKKYGSDYRYETIDLSDDNIYPDL
jgi:hypothetical protein